MIREIVCGLNYMYGVEDILGIEVTLIMILLSHSCPFYFIVSSGVVESCFDTNEIFQGGYRGFYSKNTLRLTPRVVNDIHKRGGTFLRTSRGGHDTHKIVDNIQDRGINQVELCCLLPNYIVPFLILVGKGTCYKEIYKEKTDNIGVGLYHWRGRYSERSSFNIQGD